MRSEINLENQVFFGLCFILRKMVIHYIFIFLITLGTDCNRKWVNMRDIYNRSKGKKLGTGSAAELKKRRNELMVFLDETVVVNHR